MRANMDNEQKDSVKAYMKSYRETHKETLYEKDKKWRLANPEKYKERKRRYAEEHKDEIREKARNKNRQKTIQTRQEKAQARQAKLIEHFGIDLSPDRRVKADEFAESLKLIRLNGKWCLCLRCNNKFMDTHFPQALYDAQKTGRNICPFCGDSPIGTCVISSPEVELAKLYPNFTERNIHPDWMQGLELDLYDPVAKVALEFHGLKWHSNASNTAPSAHKRKADLCEKAGVQLIQLYESEWVQRREQVIDKLDAIFHKDMTRYYARKLELRTLNDGKGHNTVNRFMDANHIQGHSGCQWAVGLFDGDEPLAICTFKYGTAYASGGHADGTEKYWELNRYATKLHTSVVGGISRCVKAFMREHPDVHTLVSFADRRWTCPTRSAYSSSGFIETGRADPNYMYTDLDPVTPLHNKQYMRKAAIERRAITNPASPEAKVFSWNKTELDMATELGWYRIYDAGKIRYEMTLP